MTEAYLCGYVQRQQLLSLHLRSYIELDSDQNAKARPKKLYLN